MWQNIIHSNKWTQTNKHTHTPQKEEKTKHKLWYILDTFDKIQIFSTTWQCSVWFELKWISSTWIRFEFWFVFFSFILLLVLFFFFILSFEKENRKMDLSVKKIGKNRKEKNPSTPLSLDPLSCCYFSCVWFFISLSLSLSLTHFFAPFTVHVLMQFLCFTIDFNSFRFVPYFKRENKSQIYMFTLLGSTTSMCCMF